MDIVTGRVYFESLEAAVLHIFFDCHTWRDGKGFIDGGDNRWRIAVIDKGILGRKAFCGNKLFGV